MAAQRRLQHRQAGIEFRRGGVDEAVDAIRLRACAAGSMGVAGGHHQDRLACRLARLREGPDGRVPELLEGLAPVILDQALVAEAHIDEIDRLLQGREQAGEFVDGVVRSRDGDSRIIASAGAAEPDGQHLEPFQPPGDAMEIVLGEAVRTEGERAVAPRGDDARHRRPVGAAAATLRGVAGLADRELLELPVFVVDAVVDHRDAGVLPGPGAGAVAPGDAGIGLRRADLLQSPHRPVVRMASVGGGERRKVGRRRWRRPGRVRAAAAPTAGCGEAASAPSAPSAAGGQRGQADRGSQGYGERTGNHRRPHSTLIVSKLCAKRSKLCAFRGHRGGRLRCIRFFLHPNTGAAAPRPWRGAGAGAAVTRGVRGRWRARYLRRFARGRGPRPRAVRRARCGSGGARRSAAAA